MAILTVQLGLLERLFSCRSAHGGDQPKQMSENVTSPETISISQVEAAIQAVMDKGWDLNPYTVAEEAKIAHTDISHNPDFMRLIVDARGGDVSFQSQDADNHSARVAELEEEIKSLKEQLEKPAAEEAKIGPDDDVLNEQVKALLSSESDEQVKHLEKELEQAYSQVVALEEDKVDLTRSVAGLEKVNEALNARLRELDIETADLKRQIEVLPEKNNSEQMESINREMALRMEELVAGNRANNEHIAFLEATNVQHESIILELEAKLAELQQEADMLALQLQNAFNIGYQKGLSDSKQQAGPAPVPTEEQAAPQDFVPQELAAAQETQANFDPNPENVGVDGQSAQVATGDQVVYTPGQYYEMHQELPNVDIRNNEPKPQAAEEDQVIGWGPESDSVLNFARTGPYVASTFNPLENLSWRDLETVYSMGVLSIRDFSRNLTDYAQNTGAPSETKIGVPPAEAPADAHVPQSALIDYSLSSESEVEQEPETQLFPETEAPEPVIPEPPKSEGALDFIDELIDIDKLDIFESLEELAELGAIEVLNEPLSINFDQTGEATGETPAVEEGNQVSDDQLRDLITNRVLAAKDQPVDQQEVRTPPAPEGAEDDASKKPFVGLKKFVGAKASQTDPPPAAATTSSSTTTPNILSKHIPQDIRKACMILGIRPEEMTKEIVNREWKKQITSVHPDLKGGDTESSIYLNTAKDTLLRWLDQNTPKLGGKFGPKGGGGSSPFTGKNKPEEKS